MKKLNSLKLVVPCIIFLLIFSSCFERNHFDPDSYVRPLEIIKLSENNYQYISYLKLSTSNFYPCNGYVYMSEGEAVVFDTPVNEIEASQLIDFIQNELKATVKGVVINHAHTDAAGGINAFAKANIPSYASNKTAAILAKDSVTITHPFETSQEIKIGDVIIENTYFGPAHTDDNIASYINEEDILYGGCMIKSKQASKGNIKDANLALWPETVQKIKEMYPDVRVVIPGHGNRGDASLLDYTTQLFIAKDSLD
jgi:metallo-beta-lactamase class B